MTEKFREIQELQKIGKTCVFLKPFHMLQTSSNHLSYNDESNENKSVRRLMLFSELTFENKTKKKTNWN